MVQTEVASSVDVLSDILDILDLRGMLYFRTDCSAPWSVQVPRHTQAARFHLVVQGRCHVRVGGGAWRALSEGDLLLVPRGQQHVLSDMPGRHALALDQVLERAGYDGRGVLVLDGGDAQAACRLMCGHFSFRAGADHPLLRALPEALHVSAETRAQAPWLDEIIRLLTRRVFESEAPSDAALARFSEMLFIELVRVGITQSPALEAVMDGFRDRAIGRALQLVHAQPHEAWSVDRLARQVGMSRSRFADRFRRAMGVGPMAYVADWRMQRAMSLLESGRESIQRVATVAGYRSPAAFSRAFHERFGMPPSAIRRAVG